MSRTAVDQATQVFNSDSYNDALTTGISLQTSSISIQDDLNALRTQIKQLIWASATGSWYDKVQATGSATPRGVNQLNDSLVAVEQQLVSGAFNVLEHEKLQQLIHLADGGPFVGFGNNLVRDVGPVPFVTSTIWWYDSTRTKRVVDKQITRNANKSPNTIQWRAYASDGVTVVESITDMILYSGAFELSRSRSSP